MNFFNKYRKDETIKDKLNKILIILVINFGGKNGSKGKRLFN